MKELKHIVLAQGDDTSNCFVCGQANARGMRLPFVREGACGSSAQYTARAEHEGWPGVLHGGITFSLLDEALAWAVFFQGMRGVTARAQTQFKKPIRTGTPLIIRGWTLERRKRLITARAEVRTAGPEAELMAAADATVFLLAERAPNHELETASPLG
jgi:acyl-coenzyme A thioesterase PaaI-like protein